MSFHPKGEICFRLFQTKITTIFKTNNCEKCPSSMRRWDSNAQPTVHESPPITTRLGPKEHTFSVQCLTRSRSDHFEMFKVFISRSLFLYFCTS